MKDINEKLESYIKKIKENPPHVLGCLSKKVDYERMLKLKKEIETNGWIPSVQSLTINKEIFNKINFFTKREKKGKQ